MTTEREIRGEIEALKIALAGEIMSYQQPMRRLLTRLVQAYEDLLLVVRMPVLPQPYTQPAQPVTSPEPAPVDPPVDAAMTLVSEVRPESADNISTPRTAVQVSEMRTVDAPAPAQELSNAETLQAPAPSPVKAKQSQAWTPEKRAAESERAKQRWVDRRAVHGPPEQVAEDVPPPISAQVESATAEPAPAPPSEPSTSVHLKATDATEPKPFCQCPANWWASSAWANGAPRTPSAEHNHLCPLHRHKWRLPPAAGLDGQTHIGRCACGATKEHGFAPAVHGNAAQRAKGQHTAAVTA